MIDGPILTELQAIVGAEHLLNRPADLLSYSFDSTPLYQQMPDVVLFPGSTAEVAAIMAVASREQIPVIPRGQGTNLSGGTVPVTGGIVLCLSRMNQILEIDQANLTATVQPGVITAHLHRQVEALGLFYPPDPGSMAVSTIGGNVAENAGGLRGLKYGVTKDYVMGLEAVLPNGEVVRSGGKNVKDVAGYDLTRLLVGSEGTLAIVTEVTLKLVPLPESKGMLLALYSDLESAARAVSRIIAARIIPATMEFMDNGTIRAVEEFAHVGLPTNVEALLLIGQDGPPQVVAAEIEQVAAICREEGADKVEVARDAAHADQLMSARRYALSALARLRPTTILEDATVPRSELAHMVRVIGAAAAKYDLNICTFGHAGDGNLHPTCLCDERDQDEIHRVEAAFAEIFDEAIALGGTITGEHGTGIAKAEYLEWKAGPGGVALMRAIKNAFDPLNILNPGKVIPKATRNRVVVRQ